MHWIIRLLILHQHVRRLVAAAGGFIFLLLYKQLASLHNIQFYTGTPDQSEEL